MDVREFFSRDRFAVENGVKLEEAEPGYARASLVIEDRHLNAGNVVQGGAVFTLADLAMAAAANANGRLAFSIQSDIRFLESTGEGDVLVAEAREVLLRRTICHYRVTVSNKEGRIIALFDGICYRK